MGAVVGEGSVKGELAGRLAAGECMRLDGTPEYGMRARGCVYVCLASAVVPHPALGECGMWSCPLPGRAASWLVSRDLRCVRCALLHYYYYWVRRR